MPFVDAEYVEELHAAREPMVCIYCGQQVSGNVYEQFEHLENIHIIKARHIRNVMVRTAFVKLQRIEA